MKKTSTSLNSWANTFVITGVIFIILAFFGWVFSADSVGEILSAGIALIFMSPIIRGLSVLVENAEEQIEARNHEQTED